MIKKTWFITGGTGSIGRAVLRKLLSDENIGKIELVKILFRSEYESWQLIRELMVNNLTKHVQFVMGDIRNYSDIRRAMIGVDIVFHAAALKHISICQENPIEAVKTNILGSLNVIEAALELKPQKVIAMSTDKACSHYNFYGLTKYIMEALFMLSDKSKEGQLPRCSCIRSGNIINSKGGVAGIFKNQKEKGQKLQVTDPNMTRFWMSLEDIASFIVKISDEMEGGEVFIPKMGSCSVGEIASIFSNPDDWEIIGARPWEVMHETLFTKDESSKIMEDGDYFKIHDYGSNIDISEYCSNNNYWKLEKNKINAMIEEK